MGIAWDGSRGHCVIHGLTHLRNSYIQYTTEYLDLPTICLLDGQEEDVGVSNPNCHVCYGGEWTVMQEFITVAPALGRRQSILVDEAFRFNYPDIVRRLQR